jgi:protein-S-isoprenylcysteine O-methyltransferase Ste14
MYVSLLLMMTGIALYNLHAVNFVGLCLVTVAVLGKVSIEERLLRARFPAYAEYAARTPRFVPRLR